MHNFVHHCSQLDVNNTNCLFLLFLILYPLHKISQSLNNCSTDFCRGDIQTMMTLFKCRESSHKAAWTSLILFWNHYKLLINLFRLPTSMQVLSETIWSFRYNLLDTHTQSLNNCSTDFCRGDLQTTINLFNRQESSHKTAWTLLILFWNHSKPLVKHFRLPTSILNRSVWSPAWQKFSCLVNGHNADFIATRWTTVFFSF